MNSSRASGSRKSVSASSRNPQASGPRSPEEDPASEVADINQLPRSVTVERASLQKAPITERMSLLPTEIDLHHDRFLAEVIAPFDHLPAKFAVEPFG